MTPIIEQFILLKQILRKEDKIIVAVSGGIDSMVLLTLLHQLQYEIAAAHCNYGLRAEASNLDEELVRSYCKKLGITCFVKRFDDELSKINTGTGIQEAARKLRYEWFDELLTSTGFNKIATAHHQDDQLETILFNLIRGTGLNGIRGIALKKDKLVRPLLCYDKEEIIKIAEEYHIPYRTDSTNLEDKYTRNKIRHHVLPVLKEINKNAALHAQDLSEWASYFVTNKNEPEPLYSIDVNDIKEHDQPAQFLMHRLQYFGFNKFQIEDMLLSIYMGKYGSIFKSEKHQLFVNKNQLEIIENTEQNSFSISVLELPFNANINGLNLKIEIVEKPIEFTKEGSLFIGLQSLEQRFKITSINDGDLIQPFGMKGHKTIGNYFTDKKVSHKLRKQAFKLEVDNRTAALIPFCIDQNFEVSEQTNIVLKIAIL